MVVGGAQNQVSQNLVTSRVQEREANCFRAKPAAQDNAAVPVLAYSVTLASSSAEPQPSRGERESCWWRKKKILGLSLNQGGEYN